MDQKDRQTLDVLKDQADYAKIIGLALVFIIGGATFYHHVEHLTWINAFYFTVITLSTVGYGDIVPHTDAGKIFTIFYVFVGIVIFLALARIVLGRVVLRNYRRRNKD